MQTSGTRQEQAMSIQGRTDFRAFTDCSFFMQGRCTNRNGCPYRHSQKAKASLFDCPNWLRRECLHEFCHLRHPAQGIQAVTPKYQAQSPMRGQAPSLVVSAGFQRLRQPYTQPRQQAPRVHSSISMMDLSSRNTPFLMPKKSRTVSVDDTDRDSASSSAGGNYNKKQMLLKNLDPETSEAAIRDYIRRLSREQATSVKFHFDKTCALIGFRSQIDIDAIKQRVSDNPKLSTLNGNDIEIHPVTFCDCLLLIDIPKSAERNDVEVEMRRVAGPHSIANLDYEDGKNYAVVKFLKTSHLASFKRTTCSIKGKSLKHFFYDGVFLSDEMHEAMYGPAEQKQLIKTLTFSKPGIGELLKKESLVHLQKRLQNDFTVTLDLNTRKSRAQDYFSQWQSDANTVVELVIGDIANVQSDVIVNSTSSSLNLDSNSSSKSLSKAAGPQLQKYCDEYTKKHGSVGKWERVITKGGSLNCKSVYHIVLGSENKKKLKEGIRAILRTAAINGCKTVAFPALGTGVLGYDRDVVAKTFDDAIKEFNTTMNSFIIDRVVIVVHDKDPDTVRAFKRYFDVASIDPKVHDFPDVEVSLKGYADRDLNTAESLVKKFVNENIVETNYTISMLANLSFAEKQKLYDFAKSKHVRMQINKNGAVTLEGIDADKIVVLNECQEEAKKTASKENRMELPSIWDPMPKDHLGNEPPYHIVKLSHSSTEFQDVRRNVLISAGGRIREIRSIKRIQNPQLYLPYMIKKQKMEKSHTSRERLLFHGTSKDSCQAINHHGFNRSFAGKNAAAYGQGNYFAVNSSYSSSTKYSRPDAKGFQYMYRARVLVGDYTQGSSELKTPPCKGRGTDLYDSVVDNVSNPSIFVVFPDNQSYPEYLIRFR